MRIRKCFDIENDTEEQFEGICEADESFFGGKNTDTEKHDKSSDLYDNYNEIVQLVDFICVSSNRHKNKIEWHRDCQMSKC